MRSAGTVPGATAARYKQTDFTVASVQPFAISTGLFCISRQEQLLSVQHLGLMPPPASCV